MGVCGRLLSDSQKWAKLKLVVAASLSIVDMTTDIIMIFEYSSQEEQAFVKATLASIFANLILQSWTTLAMYHKMPLKRQAMEQLMVWTLIKPGVNACRIASESEHKELKLANDRTEMTTIKIMELVTEAIPGTLIYTAYCHYEIWTRNVIQRCVLLRILRLHGSFHVFVPVSGLGYGKGAEEGEIGRGTKRRAANVSVGNGSRAGSYFCKRYASSIITAIILVTRPNPFRDSLRSSQYSP